MGWIELYYGGDDDILQDCELQNWITDINTHGLAQGSGLCVGLVWSTLSRYLPRTCRKLCVSCSTDFPQTFHTKAEVSQFVTMMVFSCSALHAAVNFSQVDPKRHLEPFTLANSLILALCLHGPQLDFTLWMPNCPPAMMRPPPQVKGTVTEVDIMSFLPDVNSTCRVLTVVTLLSQPALDFVRLHLSTLSKLNKQV